MFGLNRLCSCHSTKIYSFVRCRIILVFSFFKNLVSSLEKTWEALAFLWIAYLWLLWLHKSKRNNIFQGKALLQKDNLLEEVIDENELDFEVLEFPFFQPMNIHYWARGGLSESLQKCKRLCQLLAQWITVLLKNKDADSFFARGLIFERLAAGMEHSCVYNVWNDFGSPFNAACFSFDKKAALAVVVRNAMEPVFEYEISLFR